MECSTLLCVIGLSLDIIGALLLWVFGIPKIINRTKGVYFKAKADDEAEESKRLAKVRIYDFLSTTGMIFLIVGFIFQLISYFV